MRELGLGYREAGGSSSPTPLPSLPLCSPAGGPPLCLSADPAGSHQSWLEPGTGEPWIYGLTSGLTVLAGDMFSNPEHL